MFYKVGVPKYSQAAIELNTFCYRAPPLPASQYFAKFTEKHLFESVL